MSWFTGRVSTATLHHNFIVNAMESQTLWSLQKLNMEKLLEATLMFHGVAVETTSKIIRERVSSSLWQIVRSITWQCHNMPFAAVPITARLSEVATIFTFQIVPTQQPRATSISLILTTWKLVQSRAEEQHNRHSVGPPVDTTRESTSMRFSRFISSSLMRKNDRKEWMD